TIARKTHVHGTARGFGFTNILLHIPHFRDVNIARGFMFEKLLDTLSGRFVRSRIDTHGPKILADKIEIPQNVVIEYGNIAARLVCDKNVIPIFDELAKYP